jgi:hypothetical protein
MNAAMERNCLFFGLPQSYIRRTQPENFDPRVTALARPRSNSTLNYRPVLSLERALENNKDAD